MMRNWEINEMHAHLLQWKRRGDCSLGPVRKPSSKLFYADLSNSWSTRVTPSQSERASVKRSTDWRRNLFDKFPNRPLLPYCAHSALLDLIESEIELGDDNIPRFLDVFS